MDRISLVSFSLLIAFATVLLVQPLRCIALRIRAPEARPAPRPH